MDAEQRGNLNSHGLLCALTTHGCGRCDSGTPVANRQPVVSLPSRNRRQHPRTRVSWPVVVETRRHRYPCQVVDISSHGAKVMTSARLQPGSIVRLQIIPPDGTPLRVGALVWRLDA